MDQDRGPVVLAVTAAMISISAAFVLLRLVSRATIVKKVTLDDYLIVVAWIIAFGMSFSVCFGVREGLGRHQRNIKAPTEGALQRLEYTFSVLYNPALVFTKTSILVFYLSLARTSKMFRWGVIGTLSVVIAVGTALTLLNIFQCRPMTDLFTFPRPAGTTCTDTITLYLSSAPANICTDIAILFLPMPLLRSLTLPRKQKFILYITFGFFAFATIVDVVRIEFLQQASVTRLTEIQANSGIESAANTERMDFAYYASLSFMWSAVEVNVGIMCSCVPALKPLASRFIPQLLRDEGEHTPKDSVGDLMTIDTIGSPRNQSMVKPSGSDSSGSDEHISFQDFLTTPDMTEIPHRIRTDTATTITSPYSPTARFSRTFFDFVNLGESKTLMFMSNKESIRPIAAVTLLFFLWGFAYGLLNVLNNQFQLVANMSVNQGTALHSAYFLGYIIGPLTVGRLVLIHWGFKATFMVGLGVYGVGCLVFWPSAVLTSFPAFFISNLIVGFGLSILETGANPFMALCGPSQYAEARLSFAQAVQACGSVVSPLLAKKVLFNNVLNAPSLIRSQWTYLAIGLFCFALAFVYYLVKLPEATDLELEAVARSTFDSAVDGNSRTPLIKLRQTGTIWTTLALATTSMFLYVGAQECVGITRSAYIRAAQPQADTAYLGAVASASFAGTRFLVVLFLLVSPVIFSPRYLLVFFFAMAIAFSASVMQSFRGTIGTAMLMCTYAAEGPIFSLIYAQGLRGLGKHTKNGSAALSAAIGGGAIFPPIMQAVMRGNHGSKFAYAFCVPVALFAVGLLFPLYLEIFPLARYQTDPLTGVPSDDAKRLAWRSLAIRRRNAHVEDEAAVSPTNTHADATHTTPHTERSRFSITSSAPPSPRTAAPPRFDLDTTTLATYGQTGFISHDFAFDTHAPGVRPGDDFATKERISSFSSTGAKSDTPLLRVMRRLSSVFTSFRDRRESKADSALGSPVEPKAQ